MKKLKKIFMSFGVFIAGLISKVSAVRTIEMKYGISEINISEAYSEPTIGEKISRIGRVAIPIISGTDVRRNGSIRRPSRTT